jgi:signal transduction histidine kinase
MFGTLVAAGLGLLLGRALSFDLGAAASDIHDLGTDAVVSGAPVARFARFRMVARLRSAIEELSGRFRVFAQAQERAISARQSAARMRGLFFASVSHDLKSPLNAILGFSHLVRSSEVLTPGQSESLELIERRGRELLALIETILDAARVEAGQLSLVLDEAEAKELVREAIAKGKDLGAERPVEVTVEVAEGIPRLWVDPVRIPRAIATFIGHGIRHSQAASLRVRVLPDAQHGVRIEIEQPSAFAAQQIRALLDPIPTIRASEHRGLALGLRLARALVELHAGRVEITDHGAQGATISVLLPGG